MVLKFLLLGITFIAIVFLFNIDFKKIKEKYKLHKQAKEREKRKAAFRKKMKELEIK